MSAIREVDLPQQAGSSLSRAPPVEPGRAQGDLDVLRRCQAGHEVEGLEDDADLVPAVVC